MGDAADDYTDNELDQLHAHQRGECEFGCPYCEVLKRPKKAKRDE